MVKVRATVSVRLRLGLRSRLLCGYSLGIQVRVW